MCWRIRQGDGGQTHQQCWAEAGAEAAGSQGAGACGQERASCWPSVHFRKVDLLQDNVHGWVLPSDWFTSSLTLSATQVVPGGKCPLGPVLTGVDLPSCVVCLQILSI
ncbi:Hypothetical predicted protein [Marmota monax]|uniref:Uncharacterized protein n=1 Tax=Marmota monax TaxID=9995 RepID=A0A5E4BL19_MARMO|nr:hypothetical protein GHT09_014735 [Marmota monax]VTJ70394.1 Hypothetical predicted protein [Marmota monax]